MTASAVLPPHTLTTALTLNAIPGLPEVRTGDDLTGLLCLALEQAGIALQSGDVLVLAQKIVSKAEGRLVRLSSVLPSARALELAAEADKDPRLVELILQESNEVLRCRRGVIVVEHRLGFVMANAGIDQSNVPQVVMADDGLETAGTAQGADIQAGSDADDGVVLLLPVDPDASCRRLREGLLAATGVEVGVVISDSHGRAWRNGTVGVAIGVAGMSALIDMRGRPDREGRLLRVTEIGHADEVAAAASLLMGQANEGQPAVLVRGLTSVGREGRARDLVRDRSLDLFR